MLRPRRCCLRPGADSPLVPLWRASAGTISGVLPGSDSTTLGINMRAGLESWRWGRIIRCREQQTNPAGLCPPSRPSIGLILSAVIPAPPETSMRIFVLLAFLGIVASLVSAGVYLMKDQGRHSRMAHALTLRIGLSILLFLFMLLAWRLGWIEATGIPVPA